MPHISDKSHPLCVKQVLVQSQEALFSASQDVTDVGMIRLPAYHAANEYGQPLKSVGEFVSEMITHSGTSATWIVVGEVIDLVQVQACIPVSVRYQLWLAINRITPIIIDKRHLPHQHFGALVYTRYLSSLRHTKTRIKYTYCPICEKTTKDYGGKKHTYHEVGTLLSDVWRDISCDLDGELHPIIERFADLFGLEPYQELTVFDCRNLAFQRVLFQLPRIEFEDGRLPENMANSILQGDCLEELRRIPTNSIDFIFTDPPYNLRKNYLDYKDNLEIQEYFEWCDTWIEELIRILKPGHTLALLNIPLWAIRHFLYMQTVLTFQNWIVWDALAFPVRLVMPAHYTILCFSKGESRELPGLTGESNYMRISSAPKAFDALQPLADGYCLRENCVNTRITAHINDRTRLTDLWGDIHRLKHNSRRVDHPCQLPPHLMYRLISIFTKPGEVILDCFNGAGTTTLTAHQLDRRYIGIDFSEQYCAMTKERHEEIVNGLDPFRKEERVLTSKNSPVPRLSKQVYKVPKKTLQLEVKRISEQIGHIPSRDELIAYGKYAIEYYDEYFVSWGEVTAAARTTGMQEKKFNHDFYKTTFSEQLRLLESKATLSE